MQAEQPKASLKEINDLKAALDKHVFQDFPDPQGKINCVYEKVRVVPNCFRDELPL
jgi:hypothetical protein